MAKFKGGTLLGKLQKLCRSAEENQVTQLCGRCGKLKLKMTVDHIVPMSFIEMVGLRIEVGYEDADNFQLLCQTCNSLKGNRFDFSDPRTLINLKRYVALLEKIHA